MGSCKINSLNSPFLCKFPPSKTSRPTARSIPVIVFSSYPRNDPQANTVTQTPPPRANSYKVDFRTLGACKLGIAGYPDFEYDALGGTGTGQGLMTAGDEANGEISVSFDLDTLYIPPLTSATTKFLGLPLPPFLKIAIVPQFFEGRICQESGKVDLQFKAKFCFSVGSIYRAPPLIVETVLTSEEAIGVARGGRGERLDEKGKCRLVGVSRVDPIDDVFMNTFLGLPTECLANLNAVISLSNL